MSTDQAVIWPSKYNLLGVMATAAAYDEVVALLTEAAEKRLPVIASFHAVHSIVTASRDPLLRQMVNSFDILGPDGQPVRWALNLLYDLELKDRLYGPEVMLRLCAKAAQKGLAVYFYGSSKTVIKKLHLNLSQKFPELTIAGSFSPPYRALSPEEDLQIIKKINDSGAHIVFIGLGCPKQDFFAYNHRDSLNAVQVCVGAAFDFHAQTKEMAPPWMQKHGLEWLFRLSKEPKRLFLRYTVTNTIFIFKVLWIFLKRLLGGKV